MIVREVVKMPIIRQIFVIDEQTEYMKKKIMQEMDEYLKEAGKPESIFVKAQPGRIEEQRSAVKIISTQIRNMGTEETKEEAFGYGGIATGYANAANHYGIIREEELQKITKMIEESAMEAEKRIEKEKQPFALRCFRRRITP